MTLSTAPAHDNSPTPDTPDAPDTVFAPISTPNAAAANADLKFHKSGRDYHHPQIEVALISSMINFPGRVVMVAAKLGVEDFYDQRNKIIFQALVAMSNENRVITAASLIAEVNGWVPDCDQEWLIYINACAETQFNPKYTEIYVKALMGATRTRGGTYCENQYSESFCAELLESRVQPAKCIGKEWYRYSSGIWRDGERQGVRRIALECIHPFHREARRVEGV